MIRSYIYFVLLGLVPSFLWSQQNLLPNPSFEEYTDWKSNHPEILDTQTEFIYFDSSAVPGWFTTHYGYGIPYFNLDLNYPHLKKNRISNGYQQPSDGKGYVTLMAYAPLNKLAGLATKRMYLACKLNESLQKGEKYTISFDVSLADGSRRYADHLYFSFTEFPPIRPTGRGYVDFLTTLFKPNAFFSPYDQLKDTANWQTITATYTATGNENYLVVGHMEFYNLKKNIHRTKFKKRPRNKLIRSPYYFIDNGKLVLVEG